MKKIYPIMAASILLVFASPPVSCQEKGQMEPTITSKSAFKVVGLKYQGKAEGDEIPELWKKFGPRMYEIKYMTDAEVAYGVMKNFDDSTGEFDYLAAVEVDSVAEIPKGMESWDIPEQTYAVFTCTLPTLMQIYNSICNDWLPKSRYERASGPEFELYDKKFDPNKKDSKMYIYIPIAERQGKVE